MTEQLPHDSLSPSDSELVAATLAGQSDAFGTLVLRYQDRLYNTLLRILGSHHDASEVLQDAFLQAYSKLASFRREAKFYTWIYRVAFNLACTQRRRSRTVASLEQMREAVGEEPAGNAPPPEQAMVAREQAEQVQVALLRISSEHRQILVLREIEDCSYEQIADILEMPVGTVRSRLFRARLQLKQELEAMLSAEYDSAAGQTKVDSQSSKS